MLNKLLLAWRNKEATQVTALFMLVLFVSALFSGHAVAQTEQTSLLPGNGAPLMVTPEVHLTSPAPTVGATNATAGNTAGATNATVGAPLMARDLGTVPQYAGPAYTVTITPNPATLQGAAPSTPEVHLGTVTPQIGATGATAGNTAGAANTTTALPVMPRASSTVPEFTVRGSTVLITPPPDAIPSAPGSPAGDMPTGANQVALSEGDDRGVGQTANLVTDGDTAEISLGEVAREYRQRTSASRAAGVSNEEPRKSDIAAAR